MLNVLYQILDAMRRKEVNWHSNTETTIKFMKNILSLSNPQMKSSEAEVVQGFTVVKDASFLTFETKYNSRKDVIEKLIEGEKGSGEYNGF